MNLPETLRCQHHEDWSEITLQRPERGNALTSEMLDGLQQCVEAIAARPASRVVVLRGAGERFFCTGGDISAWGALTPSEMARDWILRGIDVFEGLSRLPQVVIAAINGYAMGGGLELAMAADLRVAVSSARFGTPEVSLGMIPGWMGTRRLADLVGVARARHLVLLGEPIGAAQALEWGLVTHVADTPEALDETVRAWRERACANGPIAVRLAKGLLATAHADLRHHHAAAAAEAAASEDCREGVTAFRAKRVPGVQGALTAALEGRRTSCQPCRCWMRGQPPR